MILYKNVDICDLDSIMKKGILSMDECKNNNWGEGRRVRNDTSVVYLFAPTNSQNSFPKYGTALLEMDTDAKENEMLENDIHKNDYKEYITKSVAPQEIRKVIIPELFKPYVKIPGDISVTWCGLKADYYGENGFENADNSVLERFAKTAALMDSSWFNFFRGKTENRTLIDLYNIQYVF